MTATLPRLSYGEEALAWQVRIAGLPLLEREHPVDASRRWRLDFARGRRPARAIPCER